MERNFSLKKIFGVCLMISVFVLSGLLFVACSVDTSPKLIMVNESSAKTVYLVGEAIDEDLEFNYYRDRSKTDYQRLTISNMTVSGFSTTTKTTDERTATFSYNGLSVTLNYTVRESTGTEVASGRYVFDTNKIMEVDTDDLTLTIINYLGLDDLQAEDGTIFGSAIFKTTMFKNTSESFCAKIENQKYYIYKSGANFKVSTDSKDYSAREYESSEYVKPQNGTFNGANSVSVVVDTNSIKVFNGALQIFTANDVTYSFNSEGTIFKNNDFKIVALNELTIQLTYNGNTVECVQS